MNGEWLSDIVSGTSSKIRLVDNQEYTCRSNPDGLTLFKNVYAAGSINKELELYAKRGKKSNLSVFNFLRAVEEIIGNINDESSIVLFKDKEYEHNSNQVYFQLKGNCWNNFSISTGNLIGHLILNEQEINIGCRFGHSFLKYIISDADGFLQIDKRGGISEDHSISWLIEYIWITKLKKAFRLGIPKSYLKQISISSKPKGKIDLLYHELNKELAKYKSTSRSHSYFSHANLLVLETFKYISRNFIDAEFFAIKNAFIIACEGQKVNRNELLQVKEYTNPFYNDYNEVIALSKIILNNKSLDFGKVPNASGFLFDVSMLFEYFIRKLFVRYGYSILAKNKKEFSIPTGINSPRKLFPDLIATKNGLTYLFDVKYKRFNKIEGVNREDLFQIYTYLGQVSNQNEIEAFGFIYPTNDKNSAGIKRESVTIMNSVFNFIVCLLYIPLEGDGFKDSFNRSIEMFMNDLPTNKN